jgi:hypothetical protein
MLLCGVNYQLQHPQETGVFRLVRPADIRIVSVGGKEVLQQVVVPMGKSTWKVEPANPILEPRGSLTGSFLGKRILRASGLPCFLNQLLDEQKLVKPSIIRNSRRKAGNSRLSEWPWVE